MARIKEENTVEQWFAAITGASGKSEELLRDFNKRVEEVAIPGISLSWVELFPASGMGGALKGMFKGQSRGRKFVMIRNANLEGYVIYVGSKDYGNQLLVSWYLVADKHKVSVKSKMIERTTGHAVDFMDLDLFDMEEMSAYAALVHESIKGAVEDLMKGLNLDFTKVDTHTRGFLNIS